MQWTCDWPEAKSQTFSLYQGETATFEPTFRVNGRTVTNATIEAVWYQTNGMDQAWWKLDGNTFAPSNDVGAAAYRFFVEASVPQSNNPNNSNNQTILYRANGALRMLPSPGFTPNAIEPPVVALDFAAIEIANAPWLEEETDPNVPSWAKAANPPLPPDYSNVSNKAMTALQSYSESDPTVPAWAKASSKPSYTASEVGALPDDTTHLSGDVPTSRTINGKALSSNITLSASDVGAATASSVSTLSAQVTSIGAHLNAAATSATNYTDSATNSLSASLSSQLSQASQAATNYTDASISPTSPAFSNAVLSVGLGIDTNTVAAINELVDSAQELPITGATTVGALLLALAAAVATLKKKLPYSLVTAASSVSGTTQTLTLTDRANSSATQASGVTTVALQFPINTESGKARDFILSLTCGATPPNVTFPAGATIVVDDSTDLTAEEGLNLYNFTEISANTFVASRLLVTAYTAPAQ